MTNRKLKIAFIKFGGMSAGGNRKIYANPGGEFAQGSF